MKLIIVGASGFVATELISQALRRPDVTSLVALSRKPVTAPDGENAAKLKSVVISDYGEYPDDVKKELAGANACIWTVLGLVFRLTPFGTLPVQTVAAAMLDQAVTGFEKEHLGIEDLKRIGTKAIEESGKR